MEIVVPCNIYIVTYPRSGHHAMVNFLSKISNFADEYCEYYNCTRHDGTNIPCTKTSIRWKDRNFSCGAGKRILKNHEFDLDLDYRGDTKYIVQYRHPFLSIKSWFELETKNGKNLLPWPDYLSEKLDFWKQFIQKWVINVSGADNVFLMPYNSLGDRKRLAELVHFSNFDLLSMDNLPKDHFKPKRSTIDDPDGFLKNIEDNLSNYLVAAGINKMYI